MKHENLNRDMIEHGGKVYQKTRQYGNQKKQNVQKDRTKYDRNKIKKDDDEV